jgi:hypothetical protein
MVVLAPAVPALRWGGRGRRGGVSGWWLVAVFGAWVGELAYTLFGGYSKLAIVQVELGWLEGCEPAASAPPAGPARGSSRGAGVASA